MKSGPLGTANATVSTLGADADYARERDMVIGAGAASSAAEYDALEPDRGLRRRLAEYR